MSRTDDAAWLKTAQDAIDKTVGPVTPQSGMLVGVAVDWEAGRVLLQLDAMTYRIDGDGAVDLSEMLGKAGRDLIRGGGEPPEDAA